MNEATLEFSQWLRRHDNHLRGYAPNEIATLAIACGFPLDVICGPIGDRVSFIGRLMRFWESDLAELWLRARECETGMDPE